MSEEVKAEKYLNVSGRLLRDDDGQDWPALKTARINPGSHYAKGLIAYGYVRPAGEDTPGENEGATTVTPPATPQADQGATVATVLPTTAAVPVEQLPAQDNPAQDDTSRKGERK